MFIKYLILTFFLIHNNCFSNIFISNKPATDGYLGDNIISFAIAKAMSMHYGIKMYYSNFQYSELFMFDKLEKINNSVKQFKKVGPSSNMFYINNIEIPKEAGFSKPSLYISDIIKYRKDPCDNLLYTYCLTPCGEHVNESIVAEIRRLLQPSQELNIDIIPNNKLSIAVHIRKGNGGGEHYDGELTSLQLFDFDKNMVKYHNVYTYAFESLEEYFICSQLNKSFFVHDKLYCVSMDRGNTVLSLKFPPEQFYVDQIIKISEDLDNPNIAILIVTDDHDPIDLINRIKFAVNRSNITYLYLDNRSKGHPQRIIEDLYSMSLCDGLIRSQSNFAKVSELMGDFKFIFFAGNHKWIDNKMIITDVATKKYEDFLNNYYKCR